MEKLSGGYFWVMTVLLVGLLILAFVAGQREDEKLVALSDVSAKQLEIRRLQARLAELAKSRSEFDDLMSEKNTAIHKIKPELDFPAEKMAEYEKKIQQYDDQIAAYHQQLQAIEAQYQDVIQSNQKLSQQFVVSEQALNAERAKLGTAIQAYSQIERTNQKLTGELADKNKEIEALFVELSHAMDQIKHNQAVGIPVSPVVEVLTVSGKFGVNLRVEASSKSQKLLTIPQGVSIESLGRVDNWLKVRVEGYVFNKLVAAATEERMITAE